VGHTALHPYICVAILTITGMSMAEAASEDECAIWLCLPGGFPPGCESAHGAMHKRLRHGKHPLPELNSCVQGSDAPVNADASYGKEPYVSCRAGYTMIRGDHDPRDGQAAECVSDESVYDPFTGNRPADTYGAEVRPNNGRYVVITIDGQVIPSQSDNADPSGRIFY